MTEEQIRAVAIQAAATLFSGSSAVADTRTVVRKAEQLEDYIRGGS
jgi:hypothetical protein